MKTMSLLKHTLNLYYNNVFLQSRHFAKSSILNLKQIQEVKNGKELLISASHTKSERVPYLVQNEEPHKCPLCSSGIEVKHTDVLILSQFVRSDGCMLPRRITGLCNRQQKRMSTMVTMAHKAGLMPNLTPSYSKKDPTKRYRWKQFNTYFDETTIKY